MKTTIATVLTFDRDGNAGPYKGAGWYPAEPDFTWMEGTESVLMVPVPPAPFGFFLELDLGCFAPYPHRPQQTLGISIDGRFVRSVPIAGVRSVALQCPPHLAGNVVAVTFHHAEALRPCDVVPGAQDRRALAVNLSRLRVLILGEPMPATRPGAVSDWTFGQDLTAEAERVAGMAVPALLSRFETLAGNCALGLTQVAFGADNLALLRFGGASPRTAVKLLDNGFAGVGDVLDAELAGPNNPEWMINDPVGLRFHTHKNHPEVSQAAALKLAERMIRFLRRKLIDDLASAPNKIFVLGDLEGLTVEGVMPLFLALRRHGPHTLLWAQHGGSAPPAAWDLLPGLIHVRLNTTIQPILAGGVPAGGWIAGLAQVAALERARAVTLPQANAA